MKRPPPGYIVRAIIKAELRRARLTGREPDRRYLRSETGLFDWDRLERRIADARAELETVPAKTSLVRAGAAGGGNAPLGSTSPEWPVPSPKSRERAGRC